METRTQTSQTEQIIQWLLRHAYTRNDAYRGIELIRSLLENYLFIKKDKEKSLSSAATAFEKEHELNVLEKELIQGLSNISLSVKPTTIYSFLDELEKTVSTLPILTLYIPVDIAPENVKRIGSWARENIDKQVLLSFKIDPSYIGGCGISWNGTLKDYSLTTRTNALRETISSIIAHQ